MSKSIITRYENYSVFSGVPAECHHHLCFGNGMREKADADGLWIPLLNKEHNLSSKGTINQIHENPIAEKLSKFLGHMAWEKRQVIIQLSEATGKSVEEIEDEVRENFRKRYLISFL